MKEHKYYTPEIEEFHVGFEFETRYLEKDWVKKKLVFDDFGFYTSTWEIDSTPETEFRVKYLDKEDIESLGFTNKNHKEIPSKFCYYKLINDNTIYKIQVYWHMLTDIRENLIRIYKGKLHQYPYEEIFRGNIKNKSELKKLLKQLKIIA